MPAPGKCDALLRSRLGLGDGRKSNEKRRAASHFGFEPDPALMTFDDYRVRQSQPLTGAFSDRFACKERLENAGTDVTGNASPGIANCSLRRNSPAVS